MAKYHSLVRKYLSETNKLRQMNKQQRLGYLTQIFKTPRSNEFFQGKFPEFPAKNLWNKNGIELMTYKWQPPANIPVKGIVINYNALNAHSGLSGNMAKQFADDGFIFTSYDYPNFGRSSGKFRGHIDSMQQLIDLSEQFLIMNAQKNSKLPIFMIGGSMGGFIAFNVGIRKPNLLKGSIFLNPAFEDNPTNNASLKKIVKFIGNKLPKMQTWRPLKGNSCKLSLQQYKLNDPYMYTGRVWTSTSANLLNSMDNSVHKYSEFNLDYLCIQGGTDKIVNLFKVFDFQEKAKSQQKQTIVIPDLWHAIWFDQKLQEVIDISLSWINKNI